MNLVQKCLELSPNKPVKWDSISSNLSLFMIMSIQKMTSICIPHFIPLSKKEEKAHNFWTILVILTIVVSTGSELPTTWKSRSRSFEGVYCMSLVPPVAYTPCYASQCYCPYISLEGTNTQYIDTELPDYYLVLLGLKFTLSFKNSDRNYVE